MKLLVTIDGQTFERQVEPKKAIESARGIIAMGLEREGEDGTLAIYPPHRIHYVELVAEATDPKPKSKKASAK